MQESTKLGDGGTKTYIFRVVLEKDCWPDEPESAAVWRAYVPILETQGASTWGKTKEEALKNIQEVLEMILEEFVEEGRPIPTGPENEIKVLDEPAVSITI
jgi:predicted RNase H-like HicB family nuclease